MNEFEKLCEFLNEHDAIDDFKVELDACGMCIEEVEDEMSMGMPASEAIQSGSFFFYEGQFADSVTHRDWSSLVIKLKDLK